MKKVLVINTTYRNLGGEDTNIHDEVKLLKERYEVFYLEFNNSKAINIFDIYSLLFGTNYLSNRKLKKLLKSFNPDVVYVHNTWFKAGTGIFKILKKHNKNTLLKIHSFRYDCARHFNIKNHLKNELSCNACGITSKNKKFTFFNKYYKNSYIKSLLLIIYSKKYFNILKNQDLKILTITNFHKEKLLDLGIKESKVYLFFNPIQIDADSLNNEVQDNHSLIFAGRLTDSKGVKELINCWGKLEKHQFTLKIVGKGDLEDELKLLCLNKTNIEFLGELPNTEVLRLISNSRGVIMTTKMYEGQPRLLCEASVLGRLSIYPSFGGMNEFFPKNYEYSYKQNDYRDLINKIHHFLDDKFYEEKGLINKKFIDNKLNPQQLINKFDNIASNV